MTLPSIIESGIAEKVPKTRVCNMCKSRKRLTSFYPNKGGKYGRRSSCSLCLNAEKRALHALGLGAERYARMTREQRDVKRSKDSEKNTLRKKTPKYLRNNKARSLVTKAVRDGVLVKQPCEKCGDPKVQAHHHKGYALKNALSVMWLCRKHHYAEHRSVKTAAIARAKLSALKV